MIQLRSALLLVSVLILLAGVVSADEFCPVSPCSPGSCDDWEPLWLGPVDESEAEVCQDESFGGGASPRCGIKPAAECDQPGDVLHPVGQTFVSDEGVYRIDLMMKSRGDRQPVTIKLWQWVDVDDPAFTDCAFDYTNVLGQMDDREYDATRGANPLWTDSVALPGWDQSRLVSLYPQGVTGTSCGSGPALYLLELGDPFEVHPAPNWQLSASYPTAPEAYPDGDMRMDGWFRTNQDLWMRIYTGTGTAPVPQIAAVDYGCPGCDPLDECGEISAAPDCPGDLGGDPAAPLAVPDELEPIDFLGMIEAKLNPGSCVQSPCNDAAGVSDLGCAALHAYAGLPGGSDVAWDVFAAERRYRANPNATPSGPGIKCRVELNDPDTDWGSCENIRVCRDSTHLWDLPCQDDSECQGVIPCQPSDPCFCGPIEPVCSYDLTAHGWMLNAISAYDFASQDWTEAQRSAAKALLIDGGLEFWPNREIGAFNRALAGSLTYYVLTELMDSAEILSIVSNPQFADILGGVESPESLWAEWRAYADGNWSRFRDAFDHQEDSAHYASISMGYALAIDRRLLGNLGYVSIWDEPGFAELVKREYQAQLPPGNQAVFGDTRGVARDWVLRTLLFTEAWDQLGDERFRLAAYRGADYQKRYFYGNSGGTETFRSISSDWTHMIYLHSALESLTAAGNPIGNAPLPVGHEEVVALLQADSSSTVRINQKRGGTVGQSFEMPTDSHGIFGLELRPDPDIPATIAIRLFRGVPGDSPGPELIYEDRLALPSGPSTVTIRPAVAASPGEKFYVETEAYTRFELEASASDLLPGGAAYRNGRVQSKDLWLRVKTLNGRGSTWTERPAVTAGQPNLLEVPPEHWTSDPSHMVPDKLILRSGYAPEDLHAVVNLVAADYSHRHEEIGAVISLVDDGAILLTGSSRDDRDGKHVSSPLGRHHSGESRIGPADVPQTLVKPFLDTRHVTLTTVGWDDPWGWEIRQEREIYFAKNAFLVVRDRTSGTVAPDATTSGVVWKAKQLYRADAAATDWGHLFHPVPNGVNDRKYRSYDRYLYVEMLPDDVTAGSRFSYLGPDIDDNPPTPRAGFGEVATGAGQELTFTSVLVPHDGTEWIDAIQPNAVTVVPNEAGALVLEIREPGTLDTRWLFVLNEGSAGLIANDDGVSVATDARVVMARIENGNPTYTFIDQGSYVDWQSGSDSLCRRWAASSSAEVFDAVSSPCSGPPPLQ